MHGFTFSRERARIAQGSAGRRLLQISITDRTHARTGPNTQRAQAHNHTQNSNPPASLQTLLLAGQGSVFSHLASRNILSRTLTRQIEQPRTTSQSVSQLFHGPAPRSPLHRTIERIGREGHGTFLKTACTSVIRCTPDVLCCFARIRLLRRTQPVIFFPTDFWGAALVSSLTTLSTRYFEPRRSAGAAGGGGTPRTAGRCFEPVPGVGLSPPRRAPGRVYADLVRGIDRRFGFPACLVPGAQKFN